MVTASARKRRGWGSALLTVVLALGAVDAASAKKVKKEVRYSTTVTLAYNGQSISFHALGTKSSGTFTADLKFTGHSACVGAIARGAFIRFFFEPDAGFSQGGQVQEFAASDPVPAPSVGKAHFRFSAPGSQLVTTSLGGQYAGSYSFERYFNGMSGAGPFKSYAPQWYVGLRGGAGVARQDFKVRKKRKGVVTVYKCEYYEPISTTDPVTEAPSPGR